MLYCAPGTRPGPGSHDYWYNQTTEAVCYSFEDVYDPAELTLPYIPRAIAPPLQPKYMQGVSSRRKARLAARALVPCVRLCHPWRGSVHKLSWRRAYCASS